MAPIDRENEEISKEELELVETLLQDMVELREEQKEEVLGMNIFDWSDGLEDDQMMNDLIQEHGEKFPVLFNEMLVISGWMDMHMQNMHQWLVNWGLNVNIEDFVELMWDDEGRDEITNEFFWYQTELVMDKLRQEHIKPKHFDTAEKEHQEAILEILPLMILEEMYGIHPEEDGEAEVVEG